VNTTADKAWAGMTTTEIYIVSPSACLQPYMNYSSPASKKVEELLLGFKENVVREMVGSFSRLIL
jgi:hypothetical protein